MENTQRNKQSTSKGVSWLHVLLAILGCKGIANLSMAIGAEAMLCKLLYSPVVTKTIVGKDGGWGLGESMCFIYTIALGVQISLLALFIAWRRHKFEAYMRLNAFSLKALLSGFGIYCIGGILILFSIICLEILVALWEVDFGLSFNNNEQIAFARGVISSPVGWLIIALIIPICEELLYRGFLVRELEKSGLGHRMVMFISALVFADAHLNWGSLHLLVSTFIQGFMWSWLLLKHNSIGLPITLHCLHNFFSLVALSNGITGP